MRTSHSLGPGPHTVSRFALAGLTVLALTFPARADRPPSACLLPDHTLLFASVLDVPDTRERFSRTTIAGILGDSALQPVVSDILAGIDERTAPLRESVGLTTGDLLDLPQGELTFALVGRDEAEPAPLVLIDTGDHLDDAKLLIRAIVRRIEEAGNKLGQKEIRETAVTIFESVGRNQEDVAFFKRENTLVWSNDLKILEEVLARWDGEDDATLAADADFATIMQRSRRHNPKPQVLWYLNPIAMFEDGARRRAEMQVAVLMIPALGLDGIKAVGGAIELDAGPYDSLWHAHLILDSPRAGVVEMVRPRKGPMAPPDWVPADVSDYITLHWDLPGTIDTLRNVYDGFRGEGALDEFIADRMSAPLGVDLIEEVFPVLTGRISFVRWVEKPLPENHREAALLAIELLPGAGGEELLRRVVQRHAARFMRREFAGAVYYELVRPQPPMEQPGDGGRPTSPCVGIVDDTLILADREPLYQAVALTGAGGVKRLADSDDFEGMSGRMKQLAAGNDPVLIRFQRPAERTEAWYEPIRRRQATETTDRPRPGRGPFGGLERTLRKHDLPPFESLRKYFPPSGALLLHDDTGLHYLGFTLKRP